MPGRRSTILYWPCASVTTVLTFSISAGLAASTVTPGSTAPEESLTAPTMDACAKAEIGASSTHTSNADPVASLSIMVPLCHRELFQSRREQTLGHVDLFRVVFERRRIGQRHRLRLRGQLRADCLSFQEIFDRVFTIGFARDAAEDDACVLDGVALHLQAYRQRRHREIPDFAWPDLLERRREAWPRRRNRDLGEDLVEADDVRLQASVDHDVAGHELLDGQRLRSERRGEGHLRVIRDERGRDVAGVNGIAQAPTHRGVIVAVVADGAVADVAAVAIARVAAAQILAPDFLQDVAADRRRVAQLRRRDLLHRLDEHRVLLREQGRVGDLGEFGECADLHAALAVFLDVAQVLDLLDVDEVGRRLLETVLQTDQQIGAARIDTSLGSVQRQDLNRLLDADRLVDGYRFHAVCPPLAFNASSPAMILSRVIGCSRMRTPHAL